MKIRYVDVPRARLEAHYTILPDVSEGEYGVPSKIEDDELLNLVMPKPETFEYAEKRRFLRRPHVGKPRRFCVSAWNIGSDSLLMNSGRRLALVLQKESASWFIRFAPPHSCLEAL